MNTSMRYYYTTIRMAKVLKNSDSIKCWQRCRETESLIHCWWKCKIVQSLWKSFAVSYQGRHAITILLNNCTLGHLC